MTDLVKSISKSQGTYCSLTIVSLFGKISGYIHLHYHLVSDAEAFLWLPDVFGTLEGMDKLCTSAKSRSPRTGLRTGPHSFLLSQVLNNNLAYREGARLLNLK